MSSRRLLEHYQNISLACPERMPSNKILKDETQHTETQHPRDLQKTVLHGIAKQVNWNLICYNQLGHPYK